MTENHPKHNTLGDPVVYNEPERHRMCEIPIYKNGFYEDIFLFFSGDVFLSSSDQRKNDVMSLLVLSGVLFLMIPDFSARNVTEQCVKR